MRHLSLLLACFLFVGTADRADAMLNWQPGSVTIDLDRCADTTIETMLINGGPSGASARELKLSSNITILEGPPGWEPGANPRIESGDTVRLVLRVSFGPSRLHATIVFNGVMQDAQFSVNARWNYTPLDHTQFFAVLSDMLIGETRCETIKVFNPSDQVRTLSYAATSQAEGWGYSGFTDGFVLQPGDSAELAVCFTATALGQQTTSIQIHDGCTDLDFMVQARVVDQLSVASRQDPVLSLSQHDRSLVAESLELGAGITLTDITGRTHYSAHASETTHKIDLTELPHGVYLVRISSSTSTQTRKIVVGK
jgi:hypothetical protein